MLDNGEKNMEKQKLDYSIADTYSFELEEIRNKLAQMESGRIYELSGAQMDGYLATNIRHLRKMIAVLLSKIQNGSEGTDEELATIMKSVKIEQE